MKLKLDDKGAVVLQDGKPVYVKDDGSEVAFDAAGTVATISRLNAEAKTNRERAEGAEGKLKSYEGLDDPEAARKALQTVSSLDAKKLMDVGEVEKVKAEISKAFQAQVDEAKSKAQSLEALLYQEKVGGAFARSKFIAEKAAIPADMMEARFGKQFSIEDGKIVAKDVNGNKLYSPSNPGELASPDEALELLVNAYPYKDQILKGSGATGSGAPNGQKPNPNGGKTISRAEFQKMDPVAQASLAREKGVTITE